MLRRRDPRGKGAIDSSTRLHYTSRLHERVQNENSCVRLLRAVTTSYVRLLKAVTTSTTPYLNMRRPYGRPVRFFFWSIRANRKPEEETAKRCEAP
eukprot:scaffold59538_cov59-Attheya_sp.AAC.10